MKYLIIEENMLERYTKEGNIGPNNTQYVIEGVQDEKEIENIMKNYSKEEYLVYVFVQHHKILRTVIKQIIETGHTMIILDKTINSSNSTIDLIKVNDDYYLDIITLDKKEGQDLLIEIDGATISNNITKLTITKEENKLKAVTEERIKNNTMGLIAGIVYAFYKGKKISNIYTATSISIKSNQNIEIKGDQEKITNNIFNISLIKNAIKVKYNDQMLITIITELYS